MSQPTLERGTVVGRYLVLGPIGSKAGVFAAYDPQLDRRVALRFARGDITNAAAQSLARLQHPNVVGVHDVGPWNDQVYMAMEWVDGVTLPEWLAECPRTRREILDALIAAGRGLAAAHAAGVVHGGFRADGVLIGQDDRARVTDFGWEPQSGQATDARADQYAFAAMAFDVLGPARTERWLVRALGRARSADPGARFPSMQELVSELERDPVARRRRRAAVAGALVLALSGFAAVAAVQWKKAHACDFVDHALAGIWDDTQHAELRASFALSPGSAPPLVARLDQFAADWTSARRAVCQARRSDPDLPTVAAQERCLERRRTALGAVVHFITDQGTRELERREQALRALDPIRDCAPEMGSAGPPVPPRASGDEAERALARARAWATTGNPSEAARAAQQALELAHAQGLRELEPSALYELGRAAHQRGDDAAAEPRILQSALDAERWRVDETAYAAWLFLARTRAALGKAAQAREALDEARAAMARVGATQARRDALREVTSALGEP